MKATTMTSSNPARAAASGRRQTRILNRSRTVAVVAVARGGDPVSLPASLLRFSSMLGPADTRPPLSATVCLTCTITGGKSTESRELAMP